ncbi:MAG: hypothetical protein PF489_07330 [Salinivirgaceae bacterium]|nr:hypothetical protein [Salinivirgaceae bacterium]
MKKYLYKLIVLVALLVPTQEVVSAGVLNKEKHKTFTVEKGHNLNLLLKYSDVDIVKNSTNEIEIDVTIELKENKKGEELLEQIEIVFDQSGKDVSVETKFPKVWKSSNLNIRFTIKMPEYINLNMDLKYGNAYISQLAGTQNTIKMQYGDIKTDVIASDNNQITLAYVGSADFGYINKAKCNISYSEINIKEADLIEGESAYSEFRIQKINVLNMSMTKYDEWEIQQIVNLNATARYTEFEIGALSKKIILDANFGELDIEQTNKNFELIQLNTKYTDCELNIESGASYKLDAKGAYSDISYDGDLNGTYHDKSLSVLISGTIGKSPTGKVVIDTEFGDIEL